MKKIRLVVTAVIAAALCVGASIWEGAAAVSIGGELPESGYYVATKSFPRNTVVDITNLETGKAVRAIVAAGLDSPGLLAILSREAADVIGIQTRSVGRIRMTMPSDPVAFSRFTEGLNPSRDPDHDPQAAIAAAAPRQAAPVIPVTPGAPAAPPVADDAGNFFAEERIPSDPPADTWTWDTLPAPQVSEAPPQTDMVIPPDPVTNQASQWPWDSFSSPEVSQANPAQDQLIPSDPPAAQWAWEAPPEPLPEPAAPAPRFAEADNSWPEEAGTPQLPVYPYEPQALQQQDISPEPAPELAWEAPQENPAAPRTGDAITLVPAEERPPRPYSELPPNAEIPPIASAAQIRVSPAEEEVEIPEEFIIPEVRREPVRNSTSGTLTGTLEEYPTPLARAPAERAVEPVPAEAPVQRTAIEPQIPEALFSAPVISSLEKGKYYLQLGAFSKPDLVESALTRIGGTYPLAVQTGGSPERPLYRILVGPVNLGESNALLQRFKGNGYRDAFVRQDG